MASNHNKARDACRDHLATLGLSDPACVELERGVFNECLGLADANTVPRDWTSPAFRALYEAKARSAVVNADPAHNAELRTRIDRGEFAPRRVASEPPELLMPAKWRDIKDREFKRNELIAAGGVANWSDQYRCSVCKKNQCRVFEVQTRSADEPMTIFVHCKCGNRWKI